MELNIASILYIVAIAVGIWLTAKALNYIDGYLAKTFGLLVWPTFPVLTVLSTGTLLYVLLIEPRMAEDWFVIVLVPHAYFSYKAVTAFGSYWDVLDSARQQGVFTTCGAAAFFLSILQGIVYTLLLAPHWGPNVMFGVLGFGMAYFIGSALRQSGLGKLDPLVMKFYLVFFCVYLLVMPFWLVVPGSEL